VTDHGVLCLYSDCSRIGWKWEETWGGGGGISWCEQV
jgi:hypothetical protein